VIADATKCTMSALSDDCEVQMVPSRISMMGKNSAVATTLCARADRSARERHKRMCALALYRAAGAAELATLAATCRARSWQRLYGRHGMAIAMHWPVTSCNPEGNAAGKY
jgi:hypothetical protein